MRMGSASCVITTGANSCSATASFNPVFPFAPSPPNVTISDLSNNGATFGTSQLSLTGQSDFLETNSTMTINVPRNCSLGTPCDLTLFNQHQLALAGLGQQIFQFGMFCKNSNYTGSISFEVYSSTTPSGTFKETGENLGVASGNCNIAPIALLQDSTGQADLNPDCASTMQNTPCFYKIRIVNSPVAITATITFTKWFLSFYSSTLLFPTILPISVLSDNTVAGFEAFIPVTGLQASLSPFIINFTWIAIECVTSTGYKAGNC